MRTAVVGATGTIGRPTAERLERLERALRAGGLTIDEPDVRGTTTFAQRDARGR